MSFSYRDGKRLSYRVWHQDKLLNKKRRWLARPPIIFMADGSQKRFKRPKFLTDVSLAESYVRRDEISYENLRTNIEKSFGVLSGGERSHHVVQDFLQLFEDFSADSYSINPSYFLKKFYSMLNVLSNNSLCTLANLVTDKKDGFENSRSKIKKIIKECLPKVLKESSDKNCPTLMKQISQIVEDPSNFQENRLTLQTPISPSLLSSIHKALMKLDEMPGLDLSAMVRKLKDIKIVPKFPPTSSFSVKRDVLIGRVKRKCQKVLLALDDGDDLPIPLAKALSIVLLSLKQRTRCFDVMTSEFYPFSPKVVGMQNDLLGALWSLHNTRTRELMVLQPIVDPKASFSVRAFRGALRKYLMEYLFECDVIDVPQELLSIIASLNRMSRRRAPLLTTGMIDEDVEATLSVSSQLKRTVLNLLPEDRIDDMCEALGSDDDSESNDFDLAEDSFCSHTEESKLGSWLNDDTERTEESNVACSPMVANQRCASNFSTKQPNLEPRDSIHINTDDGDHPHRNEACMAGGFVEQDDCVNPSNHYDEQAPMIGSFIKKYNLVGNAENTCVTQDFVEGSNAGPVCTREIMIQEICDETSLVAYRLIGHMLDKFLHIEGTDTDEMTRCYLRRGSSLESPGVKYSLETSEVAMDSVVLIRSVQEILPNVPKSCIEKLKQLMG